MNLIYGEIVDIFSENGMRFGKVRIGGAMKTGPLDLVGGGGCGDTVLLCDGVAIGKCETQTKGQNVFSHTR